MAVTTLVATVICSISCGRVTVRNGYGYTVEVEHVDFNEALAHLLELETAFGETQLSGLRLQWLEADLSVEIDYHSGGRSVGLFIERVGHEAWGHDFVLRLCANLDNNAIDVDSLSGVAEARERLSMWLGVWRDSGAPERHIKWIENSLDGASVAPEGINASIQR